MEGRAVWMHPESQFSADPDRGKEEVRLFVERIADANFNLIFPWVRSEYLAALTDEDYQKKVPIARWDALGELIKEAHEKGLEVHLWYSFTHYKSASSPDFNPKHGGNPGWAARRIDEIIPDKKTGKPVPRRMADACPLHSEARTWQLNLITKMLDRYLLLGGIHIEEPGYGYGGNCFCELCLQLFKLLYGFDQMEKVDGVEAEDLKCVGTTDFIRRLRETLLKRNPKLVLSTNGGYSWRWDRRLGRDWGRWARLGWLDFYAAQIYTTNLDEFRTRCKGIVSNLAHDCPVYIGIAAEWSGGKNTVETVVKQVDVARQEGAKGIAVFHGKALANEYLMALKAGPFKERTMLPVPQR